MGGAGMANLLGLAGRAGGRSGFLPPLGCRSGVRGEASWQTKGAVSK